MNQWIVVAWVGAIGLIGFGLGKFREARRWRKAATQVPNTGIKSQGSVFVVLSEYRFSKLATSARRGDYQAMRQQSRDGGRLQRQGIAP